MPRGHDGAVMLVVERCAAKVHHPDARVLHSSLFSLLCRRNVISKSGPLGIPRRLWRLTAAYLLYVVGHREVRIDKKDVLRFEVRVCQFIVVENY